MARKSVKSFEASLLELEEIIKNLEDNNWTLEESIKKYKEGMNLALQCQTILEKAEQEIYIYGEEGFRTIKEDEAK